MARKHQLRAQRAGTVINTTSAKQETDVIQALRSDPHLAPNFVAWHTLPPEPARTVPWPEAIDARIVSVRAIVRALVRLPPTARLMLAAIDRLQNHVALELVEELFHRVVMEIDALIGSTYHLHDHAGIVGKEHLVADGWLQEVLVLADPILEAERLAHHFVSVTASGRSS